ncbi:MAG: glycosyltransferase family 2 protein [Parcubacteria group bacterium]|nr:glycosyltransferase family 2 protein [Parcubacteria group bacterium]
MDTENTKRACVIVRSVGERSEPITIYAIKENGFFDSNITIIRDVTPFTQTLRVGYKKALEHGKEYTFFIDADMIVLPGTLETMISFMDRFPQKTFFMNPLAYEYTTGTITPNGPHLYRTELLKEALTCIPSPGESKRPETFVTKCMYEKGYENIHVEYPCALHEFEQDTQEYCARVIQKYLKSTPIRRREMQAYIQKKKKEGNDDFHVMDEALTLAKRERLSNVSVCKGEFDNICTRLFLESKEPVVSPKKEYDRLVRNVSEYKNSFMYRGYTKQIMEQSITGRFRKKQWGVFVRVVRRIFRFGKE